MNLEIVKVTELIPAPYNPRIHPEHAIKRLTNSIKQFGFINPIIVQAGTMMVIAGHARLKACADAGVTEVPVLFVDMDDVTARAYNIADNRLAELTEWDFPKLKDLITEIDTGAFDISVTGFDTEELANVFDFQAEIKEKEIDENIETKNECPKCGYVW